MCSLNFAYFGSKIDFLRVFPDDSAWLCVEKLQKHGFETKNLQIYSKIKQIQQKSKNIPQKSKM